MFGPFEFLPQSSAPTRPAHVVWRVLLFCPWFLFFCFARGLSRVLIARIFLMRSMSGLSADGKSIIGRWPSQMAELKQLQELARIEGWAPEYWSPPPAWKVQ